MSTQICPACRRIAPYGTLFMRRHCGCNLTAAAYLIMPDEKPDVKQALANARSQVEDLAARLSRIHAMAIKYLHERGTACMNEADGLEPFCAGDAECHICFAKRILAETEEDEK